MSCQSAPDSICGSAHCFLYIVFNPCPGHWMTLSRPCTLDYGGFFGCGQGHRGPMIPYCPGAP
ncbi:unnamed protein product, partial [Staurois parvus]